MKVKKYISDDAKLLEFNYSDNQQTIKELLSEKNII